MINYSWRAENVFSDFYEDVFKKIVKDILS